jgi:hypothetical protein
MSEQATATTYRGREGISATAIKAAWRQKEPPSMAHMRLAMLKTDDGGGSSPAMRWGTLAHAAMLEPAKFAERAHQWSGGRKAGKEWDAFAEGKDRDWVVTPDEYAELADMQAALRADQFAREIVSKIVVVESQIAWEDARYGKAKAKLDGADLGGGVVVEYKTASSIDARTFHAQAYRLGYHLQLAWYWHGLKTVAVRDEADVFCLVQESSPPYCVVCYHVPRFILEQGYTEASGIAATYRAAERAGVFMGPFDGIQEYALPRWAYDDFDPNE